MSLQPRFRRVAALHRRFVDRDDVRREFTEQLSQVVDGPRVFNVIGVGGIGKSRLIRELKDTAGDGYRTATLDLQLPAMAQQESALAVLRKELGAQDVRFDRFDIAYAVLWQRLHPHLTLTRKDLPFAEEGHALFEVLDSTTGVPVFGAGYRLIRLAAQKTRDHRRSRMIERDETLAQLDELGTAELLDAVTFLFAEDLRASNLEADEPKSTILFVDAYEAMTVAQHGNRADKWLRDLVAQIHPGITVVASREPLDWASVDPDWEAAIRTARLDGLPEHARIELLETCGVTDPNDQSTIARASAGVPFYLQLAADTYAKAARGSVVGVVSSEEILERFLEHVQSEEIRTLKLLSLARIFDFTIFHAIATAFHLPAHRLFWDSLVSYSFVYPAGQQTFRLHQLMRTALRHQLSPESRVAVHTELQAAWNRQTTETQADSPTEAIIAIREAAYSGLAANLLDADQVLDYADQALRLGGKQAVDGLRTDLTEYLDDHAEDPADDTAIDPERLDPDRRTALAEAARLLDVESAIVLGDAVTATELTAARNWNLHTTAGARIAIAAAHGRRIAGATGESGEIYRSVWEEHTGPVRWAAGLWVADIHMWQGRFVEAFATAEQVLAGAPDDDLVLRGDLVRLLHLGHRFDFQFAASADALDEAVELYTRAGTVIGLANVRTNRAELLAWTDPAAAVPVASKAIDEQQELGALHELGKTYTALAVAQVRLGETERAATSFRLACEALERARYRSGRARAEMFRAFLHLRNDDVDEAVGAIEWAVREFEQAEVYPTLILAADFAVAQVGVRNERITEAADRARAQVHPLDSMAALESRAAGFVRSLIQEAG